MTKQTEMVKVTTWVLCLVDWDSNNPVFYYNPREGVFQRQFNSQCAYWSEEPCLEIEKELNLEGVQVLKGTMDVPRDHLIDSIMEAFVGVGLVKKGEVD